MRFSTPLALFAAIVTSIFHAETVSAIPLTPSPKVFYKKSHLSNQPIATDLNLQRLQHQAHGCDDRVENCQSLARREVAATEAVALETQAALLAPGAVTSALKDSHKILHIARGVSHWDDNRYYHHGQPNNGPNAPGPSSHSSRPAAPPSTSSSGPAAPPSTSQVVKSGGSKSWVAKSQAAPSSDPAALPDDPPPPYSSNPPEGPSSSNKKGIVGKIVSFFG
ncbi:hypothetical protein BC835DRAFT_571627 [Cytidiella melzeri]|nr:hypothetical protein BC835DRAFT_571627 [Cytidiella melzeri]